MAETPPAGRNASAPLDVQRARIDSPDEDEAFFTNVGGGMTNFPISGRILAPGAGRGGTPASPAPTGRATTTYPTVQCSLQTPGPTNTTFDPVTINGNHWSTNCTTDYSGDATLVAVLVLDAMGTMSGPQDSVDIHINPQVATGSAKPNK